MKTRCDYTAEAGNVKAADVPLKAAGTVEKPAKKGKAARPHRLGLNGLANRLKEE